MISGTMTRRRMIAISAAAEDEDGARERPDQGRELIALHEAALDAVVAAQADGIVHRASAREITRDAGHRDAAGRRAVDSGPQRFLVLIAVRALILERDAKPEARPQANARARRRGDRLIRSVLREQLRRSPIDRPRKHVDHAAHRISAVD